MQNYNWLLWQKFGHPKFYQQHRFNQHQMFQQQMLQQFHQQQMLLQQQLLLRQYDNILGQYQYQLRKLMEARAQGVPTVVCQETPPMQCHEGHPLYQLFQFPLIVQLPLPVPLPVPQPVPQLVPPMPTSAVITVNNGIVLSHSQISFKVSRYMLVNPEQFRDIAEQLDMAKTYFLCVQYKKTGDIQIFITGTLKQGESPVQCAKRESKEEARLCFPGMTCCGKTTRNGGQPITLCCTPLKGATLAPEGVANAQEIMPDVWGKVAVIAYGTEADIRAIYANSSEAQKYGDKINSVVYIQGSVLCEIMKRLEFDPSNRDTSFLYRQ